MNFPVKIAKYMADDERNSDMRTLAAPSEFTDLLCKVGT